MDSHLVDCIFTTREYGMDWFASIGLGNPSRNASFVELFWTRFSHLVLPIFCSTYGSLAFIARQMRGSMQEVLLQNYIRTARAKGLSESKVIWKHGFRNALFPLLTLLGGLLAFSLSGFNHIGNYFQYSRYGLADVPCHFRPRLDSGICRFYDWYSVNHVWHTHFGFVVRLGGP
ncbi:MAG: ABC transporter permease [Saprospiraceae bacterium]|nr:ABC transporter permease [Saprospiraceae bacterium]